MDKTTILKGFNNHFLEFGQDLMNILPDDYDLKTAYTFLEGLKKINPKKIIEIWHTWILKHYKKEIDDGDYMFFENKDYGYDIGDSAGNSKLLKSVEKFKNKCSQLNKKNKEKSMKYVQNLSKLCEIYYN